MYGGIYRAINEAAALREDGAYTYVLLDPGTGEAHSSSPITIDNLKVSGAENAPGEDAPAKPSTTLKEVEVHPSDYRGRE